MKRFKLYNDYFGDMKFIGEFDTLDEMNVLAFDAMLEACGEFKPVILEYNPQSMSYQKFGGDRNGN